MNEITLEASIASFTMGDLLGHIRSMIQSIAVTQKDVLTLDEAAIYTGLSKTYLYKLTGQPENTLLETFWKNALLQTVRVGCLDAPTPNQDRRTVRGRSLATYVFGQ